MMATPTMPNTSGIPKSRAPEINVFYFVERSEAVTRGISKGLEKPMTNMASPSPSRHFAAGFSFSIVAFPVMMKLHCAFFSPEKY
jgi:hypothetical protein